MGDKSCLNCGGVNTPVKEEPCKGCTGVHGTPKHSKWHPPKDCFGYYDDGDEECEKCLDSNSCFKKGVV